MDYPYDVGSYVRKVTTRSDHAQRWFDRGLNWCFGYHHEEAARCFEEALAADPGCAMAYWGLGYASGPNYNLPWKAMDESGKAAALGKAHDAARAALAQAGGVTAPERALIEALPVRYPQREPLEDQGPWNDAFADAMRSAHNAHPEDLDVTAIFVEAILNRTPWRMWDPRTGEPAPEAGTLEAREVLETAFRDLPGALHHPGLLHLYVHLMEMSPQPQLALGAADRLREIAPDMGHLTHMPTHIDIQCGHYRDAMHWNQKAIVADRRFYDRAGPMNMYSGYRAHNYHFAAYGAMFLGQYAPDPDLYLNTTAMLRYAKGVAHAALGDVRAAEAEQALFREAAQRVPKSRYIHNVRCVKLLAIAEAMLEGEIAYRRGEHDAAFAQLRAAVALEDDLPYDEPWGWMQPVRHALGALLLEQSRVAEAEAVYREDLGLAGVLPRAQIHPDNLWALRGLLDCLDRRGETAEAALIRQRVEFAAARADTPVAASCFCARTAIAAAA